MEPVLENTGTRAFTIQVAYTHTYKFLGLVLKKITYFLRFAFQDFALFKSQETQIQHKKEGAVC